MIVTALLLTTALCALQAAEEPGAADATLARRLAVLEQKVEEEQHLWAREMRLLMQRVDTLQARVARLENAVASRLRPVRQSQAGAVNDNDNSNAWQPSINQLNERVREMGSELTVLTNKVEAQYRSALSDDVDRKLETLNYTIDTEIVDLRSDVSALQERHGHDQQRPAGGEGRDGTGGAERRPGHVQHASDQDGRGQHAAGDDQRRARHHQQDRQRSLRAQRQNRRGGADPEQQVLHDHNGTDPRRSTGRSRSWRTPTRLRTALSLRPPPPSSSAGAAPSAQAPPSSCTRAWWAAGCSPRKARPLMCSACRGTRCWKTWTCLTSTVEVYGAEYQDHLGRLGQPRPRVRRVSHPAHPPTSWCRLPTCVRAGGPWNTAGTSWAVPPTILRATALSAWTRPLRVVPTATATTTACCCSSPSPSAAVCRVRGTGTGRQSPASSARK